MLVSRRNCIQAVLSAGTLGIPWALRAEPKFDNLLVYGDGFSFSVKEPPGWRGDTTNAERYSANVILYESRLTWDRAPAVIRILVADKVDENTQADMDADMNGYRARFPTVTSTDFAVTHPKYRVISRVFSLPGSFYEYVSYVNPGPKRKLQFSVSMNKQTVEASAREVAAYGAIVASLVLL